MSRIEAQARFTGADSGEAALPEPAAVSAPDARDAVPPAVHAMAKAGLVLGAAQLLIALILVGLPQGFVAAVAAAALAALAAAAVVLWAIRPHIVARDGEAARLADMQRLLRREIDGRIAADERLKTREQEFALQISEIEYVKDLVEQQAADTVGLAEDLAAQKQAIEESKRQTEYLANHDTLTGLPNRRQFEHTLRQRKAAAEASGTVLTLIYIDLDHFKTVNDSLGHGRGDELLVDVGKRLRAAVRENDFVARLGGDEFAVLTTAPVGRGSEVSAILAQRIRNALLIPVSTASGTIPVSATLGVAASPGDATDEQALLRCADRAMYAAKERGRNCVVFHKDFAATPACA